MIRLIVAVDQRMGIAKDGVQPWKLPTDEAYFNTMTKQYGAVVVMGRTTHEVISRPLPDRKNYVLTSHPEAVKPPAIANNNLSTVLSQLDDVWIIGGAKLYAATIDQADELYITRIDTDYDCNTFFPAIPDKFKLTWQDKPQQENGDTFWYERYDRL